MSEKNINVESVVRVIDYNDKEQLKSLGIKEASQYGRVYFGDDEEFERVKFCNFPILVTDGANFVECVFENIKKLEFSMCEAERCTFTSVSEIEGGYTNFTDCLFCDCVSDGAFLTIDSAGKVNGCTFRSVTAHGEEGYIIYSVFARKKEVTDIELCRFYDCKAENAEGELAHCCFFLPFSSYKTKDCDKAPLCNSPGWLLLMLCINSPSGSCQRS